MKKYELTSQFVTNVFGTKLFQIKALVSFGDVSEGDIGGYIEKEKNLSHEGDAWVSGNARVYGHASVSGNAWVSGNALVYGNARVYGDAWVCGDAGVYGDAQVYGDAWVYGNARVSGNALVFSDARVCGQKDYSCTNGLGSIGSTTFFRTKDGGVTVSCGCFSGTISEFRENVKEAHKDTKLAKEYLMLADLMEYHFLEED